MAGVDPIVTLAEAQAFARVDTGDEEALLAGLVRTASALCEAFLGTAVIARTFEQTIAPGAGWTRLDCAPVQSITAVDELDPSGAASALPSGEYETDIDSNGNGWVRVQCSTPAMRLRVRAVAGMAASRNDVPEPIRQGVLRLAAHMFASRDGEGGEPPAAVTALWRPYRRVRL